MIFKETLINNVYIVEQMVSTDLRGAFLKNFQYSEFESRNLECHFTECYYTESHKDVIRGMHFQSPPHDHAKYVSIILGTIIDVVLDIRPMSKTYGKYIAIELSRENRKSLYIPKGVAHGFGVVSKNAIAYYQVTSEYKESHDKGILYDSFGYNWPISNPIISDRDKAFPKMVNFDSPF